MAKRPPTGARKQAAAGEDTPLNGARIALLHGKEAFLRQAWTDRLREAVEAAGGAIDILRYDGMTASVTDVLDECRSMGLMAQHKLVIVDNADDFLKETDEEDEEDDEPPPVAKRGRAPKGAARPAMTRRALLERYAQAPSPDATLILRADGWRRGNLDRMIEKVGLIVDCEPLKPFEAVREAQSLAQQRHQSRLEPDAARLLVERVGPDLERVNGALARLSLLAGRGEPIDLALVRETVGLAREEKAWTIQDVLLDSDPGPALALVRELMEVSRLDPVPIRWASMDLAAKVHAASRRTAQGESADAAMRSIRVWGPVAERLKQVGPRLSPAASAELLRQAVETDWRGKTGQGDPLRGLEMLVVEFADTVKAIGREPAPR